MVLYLQFTLKNSFGAVGRFLLHDIYFPRYDRNIKKYKEIKKVYIHWSIYICLSCILPYKSLISAANNGSTPMRGNA